jgi:hypothetical protein
MRPLVPVFLLSLSLAASTALSAADTSRVEPALDTLNLQLSRGPDGDQGSLQLGLVAQFPDRRLLGWKDATVALAETDDGQRLHPGETGDAWAAMSRDSEDDLAVPLSVTLTGFTSPPLRLKRLRILATAVLAHGDSLDLALPAKPQNRIFAPADDPRATVRAERQEGNWQLTLSARLSERCLRIQLRRPDGAVVPSAVEDVEQNPQHRVVSVQPHGDGEDLLPVLVLAQHIEYRAVTLEADGLALFGTLRNPELLPLGKDPGAHPAGAVKPPAEPATAPAPAAP